MKTHIGKALSFIVAVLLFSAGVSASATPKAAEGEDAPVTMGADVEKPRASTRPAKTPTAAEKKQAGTKIHGGAKPTTKPVKAHKTTHGKARGR